jgi:hypothetical protein
MFELHALPPIVNLTAIGTKSSNVFRDLFSVDFSVHRFEPLVLFVALDVVRAIRLPACDIQPRLSYNRDMEIRNRSRKRNRIFGIVLLAVSVLLALYALWPTSYRTEVFSVSSSLLPQKYQIEVRYPRVGPAGEIVTVEVYWRPEGQTVNFTIPGESNPVIVAEVQSAEITFSPEGQVSTPLQEGKQVHFSWEAMSSAAGGGQFNLFFFRAGSEEAEGVYIQQPVWARTFPYQTFTGPGGLKIPLLFFAVLGTVFGLGYLLKNTLRAAPRHATLR